MDIKNCKDCKIHSLIKNQCDESVLQEFIDNYCNKCNNNDEIKVKEYTQNEFIEIIESGKTDSTFKVDDIIHLNHDLCNTFKVIDVNHDNTTNTVDIMPVTQVGVIRFGDDDNRYENSVIRKWINGSYIHGFDIDIRHLLQPMIVEVNNNSLYNEYAKILSATEIGLVDVDVLNNEGEKYPIFEKGNYNDKIESRCVDKGNYGDNCAYFLRSRSTTLSSIGVWHVRNSSACGTNEFKFAYGILPVLRF